MKFEEIPDVSKKYVAMGDNGKAYNASYSVESHCMFFAIPSHIEIKDYIPLEELPLIGVTNAKSDSVFRLADGWMQVTAVKTVSEEEYKVQNRSYRCSFDAVDWCGRTIYGYLKDE